MNLDDKGGGAALVGIMGRSWEEPVRLEVGCREGLSSCLLAGMRIGQKASQQMLWRQAGP